MSQNALSDFSGRTLTPDFISLIERGVNAPSFESIELLASALSVEVADLFTLPVDTSGRQRVAKGAIPSKRGRKPANMSR
jgi:transcriptional regulator with XRE-family HTH domain